MLAVATVTTGGARGDTNCDDVIDIIDELEDFMLDKGGGAGATKLEREEATSEEPEIIHIISMFSKSSNHIS